MRELTADEAKLMATKTDHDKRKVPILIEMMTNEKRKHNELMAMGRKDYVAPITKMESRRKAARRSVGA